MHDALPLASFKLRFFDDHVRVVPAKDQNGCSFAGPGVDLVGDEARDILSQCGPLLAWFDAREPGVSVRTTSMDLATGRVLVTLEVPGERPRVLRFDADGSRELVELAAPIVALLGALARKKLLARTA